MMTMIFLSSIKSVLREDTKICFIQDGFLLKAKRLCVPQSSIRLSLVREAHEGGLMGHFGVAKTLDVLHEHFFWPHMHKHVQSLCDKCIACRKAKSKMHPHGLYTPLPILQCLGLIYLWISS